MDTTNRHAALALIATWEAVARNHEERARCAAPDSIAISTEAACALVLRCAVSDLRRTLDLWDVAGETTVVY